MEDKISWALKLLTTLRLSPKVGFMNTIGQLGMRLAKFLDSMIQEQLYPRGQLPPNSPKAKEIRDCCYFCFRDFLKMQGI
jgi:hypothetical protein